MPTFIEQLAPHHGAAYKAVRLAALRECPTAFNSSHEEEKVRSDSDFASSLAPSSNRVTFGTFAGAQLVAVVSVTREQRRKVSHKGSVSGMYVAASHRGRGLGKQLLAHALEFADSQVRLSQLTLVVNAANASAISLYESCGFKMFGIEPAAAVVDGVLHAHMHMVRLNLPPI